MTGRRIDKFTKNTRNMDVDSPGIVDSLLATRNDRKSSMITFLDEKVKACQDSRNLYERLVSDPDENVSIQQINTEMETDIKNLEGQEKISHDNIEPVSTNVKEPIETEDRYSVASDDYGDIDDKEINADYILDEKNNKKLLGQGTFGKVYLIRNQDDQKKLAMKEIPFSTKSSLQNIQNEIAIHKDLNHVNIITLETWIGDEMGSNMVYLVLECVPGGSLQKLLMEDWKGAQTEKVAVIYINQLLKAIHYLHKKGIIHCDIKPQNILIDEYQGILKLCDFGHAQRLDGSLGAKEANCGTPNYNAPEIIDIPVNGYGKPVDIWSLGCTTIEILTGKAPHSMCEASIILYQVGKYNKLPEFPKNISPACEDFLRRCFIIEPSKRATVEELLRHPFITGLKTLQKVNNKQPLEHSESFTGTDCYGLERHLDENIDTECHIDYNPSINVVIQKPNIAKEMYNPGSYCWSNEDGENMLLKEDKELTKLLEKLDIPEEEIQKFIDEECTLNGLLLHMEYGDLEDLHLKIEYRARIWHHVQTFRHHQKKETGVGDELWKGLCICFDLYNVYMMH